MWLPQGFLIIEAGSYKLKEEHLFDQISEVVVSSLTDGIVILRLPTDTKDSKVSVLIIVAVCS